MKNLYLVVFLFLSAFTAAQSDKKALPLPQSGDVTLSLDEYNRLIELASKPAKHPDLPPQNYSLQCAELTFRIEDQSVIGTVQLEGEVFRKGMTKVPLIKDMTTLDARQDGKGVPLQQENGSQYAVLSGPAGFAITLSTALPLRFEAGRASFTLPAPEASSAQLTFVVPGDHTSVNISPGLITKRTSASGNTTIEATLVPGQAANVWWATRESAAQTTPKQVRFLSDVKTLLSVSESELRAAALADITVVQGQPSEFVVEVPAGYEVTGVTGASLESSEMQENELVLKVANTSLRHQFLISIERSISDSQAIAPFLSFKQAQRETGEVLVEGIGTMELTATETGALKRIDVKEVSNHLRSMAHDSPQAAFRFHRQPNEQPGLTLSWTRFPDSSVLAALAENASVTTFVTSEGKTLTEVRLTVKNQAQPFLRVTLPAGATILTADVAGERVKPVQGPDGNRVPLLRPGFRPSGPYQISFVFMHSGTPFAKKGGSELTLPSMDLPISMLNWEVFLPERYQVKDFGGDVIAAGLLPPALHENLADLSSGFGGGIGSGIGGGIAVNGFRSADMLGARLPGQLGGLVLDAAGALVPGAHVSVTVGGQAFSADTNSQGRWMFSNVPSGQGTIRVEATGFRGLTQSFNYDAQRPAEYVSNLDVAAAAEVLVVAAQAAEVPVSGRNSAQLDRLEHAKQAGNSASANVVNLQRRVAGVLPVAMDVPRTGTSFQFARALVLDEETKVTFSYKSR